MRICELCVMNETDPNILFFGELGCNHCIEMRNSKNRVWFESKNPSNDWPIIVDSLSKIERKKGTSCILALSGGIDSCNLAYLVHSYGIRPLVVHVDTGWNTALSYKNLNAVISATGWELETVVIDWEEMRQLQIAYLKSGVPNLDVPQDHAIFASIYNVAKKQKHKIMLSGGNMASEGIFPLSWHHAAMDRVNLRSINKSFGTCDIFNIPTVSFLNYYFINPFIRKMRTLRPLNLVGYSKSQLSERVKSEWGIETYSQKHGESSFTSFFQNHILPTRFGIDKRIAHLSSLIVSENITRDQALKELHKTIYTESELSLVMQFIARRLQISEEVLRACIDSPTRKHEEFRNWNRFQKPVMKSKQFISRMLVKDISRY